MKKSGIDNPSPADLLSLAAAAKRLGVHPGTLRRWSNEGQITPVLTPGGHRRFKAADIESIIHKAGSGATESMIDRVLTNTRTEIDGKDAAWLSQHDEEKRRSKREQGQRLMGVMMSYVAGDSDELLTEATAMGRQYAAEAKQDGLSLEQALKANMFFRDRVVESVVNRGASEEESKQLLRRVSSFLNAIELAMVESFNSNAT